MQNDNKKRRVIISPARVSVIAISGLLLGLCLYIVNARLFCGDSMPMPFGIGAGVVLSGSMEPELSVNDLIIVRRAEKYSVGDVVVYRRGEMSSSVVHRIVSADSKTVVTQGDANNTPDAPISPSDISGRVVASLPQAGLAVDFLRTPSGALLMLGAALLLLELSFRSEKAKGDREIEKIKAEIMRLGGGRQGEAQTDHNSADYSNPNNQQDTKHDLNQPMQSDG